MKARVAEELFLAAPNRIGLLADIAERLAASGVDIKAIGAYEKGGRGEFMMITSDNDLAAREAEALGADVERNKVVVVEMDDRPGALASAAHRLAAAEIDIDWVYATTGGVGTATVVFKTAEPERTAQILGSGA